MCKRPRSPLLAIIFAIVAIVSLLMIGAVRARQEFLARGIPAGLPEPMPGAGPKLGINIYLDPNDENAVQESMEAIKTAGYQTVKQSFYYDENYDWQATDRLMASIEQNDLTIIPLLDGNPDDDYAVIDLEDFASWAGEFARRYGAHIGSYIIWDEPNLSSHWGNQPVNPAEYAALLSATSAAIRAADPASFIVAAPLAPTIETGPQNLADHLFLQALYDAGISHSFDAAAGKPYGFDVPPDDRTVDSKTLNFSRVILLREVMDRNGDLLKPIWAGNWGWNSLPPGWEGDASIWGQVEEEIQAAWTIAAFNRARLEWSWMGFMFLENWEPAGLSTDPQWGFSIAGRSLAGMLPQLEKANNIAWPGFHPAGIGHPTQDFSGAWRFSPGYGADTSQPGDAVAFRFWGTDVGLRVRRADVRGRFYVSVDGEPANDLPIDENGAALLLTSADPADNIISTEVVAHNLPLKEHTLTVFSPLATDQWSLNGFSVGYNPPERTLTWLQIVLATVAVGAFGLAICTGRQATWGKSGRWLSERYSRLNQSGQLFLTALSAILVAASGWLTWGEHAAGIYRRLGDGGQLALTAAAASIFYISPSFLLYMAALAILFALVFFRPAWGLALVAFSIPFHVKPKLLLGYRFSPVEIFLLVTFGAFALRSVLDYLRQQTKTDEDSRGWHLKLVAADWAVILLTIVATLSLFVTERLSVATNEWRVVILEPAIFYFLLRLLRLREREMWVIFDAFVAAGVLVALIGLGQYITGQNLITSEAGLMRLRSIFGSPNNVALYLGRITPILVAMVLMSRERRRTIFAILLFPVALASLLTFSKGALLLGLPLSLLVVVLLWRRSVGGRLWPWLVGTVLLGLVAIFLTLQIPQISARLDPRGETGIFRLNLWRSSLNMFLDHPLLGVGLDNFLYEYRGRYIIDAAWKEPNLNHPHNIFLDFATRLGLLGLVAGGWLFWTYFNLAQRLSQRVNSAWQPVAAGLLGSFVYIMAHGLVDHSFFLTDLAYAFYFLLGLAVWLEKREIAVE